MASTTSKLSLVAQFDDFCRRFTDDTTSEELFLEFVLNQEECRKRWHAVELENAELRKQAAALAEANMELEGKLAYTKDVLEKELLRREKCEQEKLSKQRQLELIREFIMNDTELREETLTFLKQVDDGQHSDVKKLHTIEESVGSVLSPSDISDEDEHRRRSSRSRGKRCSSRGHLGELASPHRKKSKGQEDRDRSCASVVATTTVTVTDGKDFVATSRVYAQPHTLPAAVPTAPPEPPACTPVHTPLQTPVQTPVQTPGRTPKYGSGSAPNTPVCQRRSSPSSGEFAPLTPARRTNSAGKLMSKQHAFVAKTMMKTETCGPCGKRILFYKSALKCNCCRSVCHPECREKVPLPCVAVSQTPTPGRAARRGTITDHAPSTSPMVPALVVHCIQEVERRGLSDVGLYRVPGGAREVHELREQFQRGKGIPNLSQVDIHAICSVLKDFLRSLRETLITKSLWHVFVKAAELPSGDRTYSLWQAVNELPPANRDTLAALVLHLQTVASSPQVKMPVSNLARVFGPTVVGYSVNDAAAVSNLQAETRMQAQVMEALLNLPGDYWAQFLNWDSDDSIHTPEIKPGPQSELLGPIYNSSGGLTGSSGRGKKSARPTPKSAASVSRRANFFASPTMK